MTDPDIIEDALASAAGYVRRNGWSDRVTAASPSTVRKVRGQICRFLEDLPGELSIHELREALDDLEQEGREDAS